MNDSVPNLSGEWIGHYPGHFDEVIRILQEQDHALVVKLTGNEYLPEGNVTWWANQQTGDGEGQVAEQEYRNPHFVPGKLTIVSPQRIVFRWAGLGEVEFRRDD